MFVSFNKLRNFIKYLKNNSGKNAIIYPPLHKSVLMSMNIMNIFNACCKLCQ